MLQLHKYLSPFIQSLPQRRGVRPEPREARRRNELRLPRTAALRNIVPSALRRDGALRRRPRGRRPRSLQVHCTHCISCLEIQFKGKEILREREGESSALDLLTFVQERLRMRVCFYNGVQFRRKFIIPNHLSIKPS